MIRKKKAVHFLRKLAIFVLAALLALATAMPVCAATRKKITSVKVTVSAHILPDTRYGSEEIDVDVGSGNYSFDYYEVENDGFGWSEDDIPVLTIYLQADDDYYFSLTKGSAVELKGAEYVKATKENSSETLAIQVKLDPLNEAVSDFERVTLTDSGYAYWDTVRGAGSYDLRVYRNGNFMGTTDIKTEATEYNLKDYMNKAGSYFVRVRACNAKNTDNKTDWVESKTVTISSERAREISEGLNLDRPRKGDWEHTDAGFVYRYEDGSLAVPGWLCVDDCWYYFDANSIMMTGWITAEDGLEYYMESPTGRLLTNGTTPDGYKVDENGNKKTD